MRFAHKCPSMYIFSNNFSIIYITQCPIENRQYLVHMIVTGIAVVTESAIAFPLPVSQ